MPFNSLVKFVWLGILKVNSVVIMSAKFVLFDIVSNKLFATCVDKFIIFSLLSKIVFVIFCSISFASESKIPELFRGEINGSLHVNGFVLFDRSVLFLEISEVLFEDIVCVVVFCLELKNVFLDKL